MITEYTRSKNINFKKYSKVDLDLFECNDDEIVVQIRGASSANQYDNTIGEITLLPVYITDIKLYDNDVYFVRKPEEVNYKNLDEYKSSLQKITSFSYG